jgi:hypothetical protein
MDYSNSTRERLLHYLADNGPSTSAEIETALNISQPVVSRLLKGEAIFGVFSKVPSLIYNIKDASTKGKPPRTIRACLAENLRIAILIYRKMRSIDEDDYESLEDLAHSFIKASGKLHDTVEAYLRESRDPRYDS